MQPVWWDQRVWTQDGQNEMRETGEQVWYCRGHMLGSLDFIITFTDFEQISVSIKSLCTGGWETRSGTDVKAFQLKDDYDLVRSACS